MKKQKISFADCEKILNKNEKKYSEKAIIEIKDFMELMAEIILANDKK